MQINTQPIDGFGLRAIQLITGIAFTYFLYMLSVEQHAILKELVLIAIIGLINELYARTFGKKVMTEEVVSLTSVNSR